MYDKFKEMDEKELQLPETTYSRDIESKVFQAIVFQALAKIEGITLLGGTLIDSLLGRDTQERFKGICVEQDLKKHSVSIRIELNIMYGISIPEKAEEIQTLAVEEISKFTGLHVSGVHVIFKNLLMDSPNEETKEIDHEKEDGSALIAQSHDDEYNEGF